MVGCERIDGSPEFQRWAVKKTWFISDTHFGHARIIEMASRPFSDVDAMDEAMIARWNARVAPEDVVWHLGDFAVTSDAVRVAAIFRRLHGEKHLVLGNHDEHYEATRALPWASIGETARGEADRQAFFLCHYPMLTWPGARRGAAHLFGHMHGRLPGCDMSCDMAVEAWDYAPAQMADIRGRMRKQRPDPDFDPKRSKARR